MSELTLRFGEARLHVEGDADLVARERAAFLEHLGRLDRQSEKVGELLAVLLRAGHAPEKAEEPVSKKAEPEEPAEEKSVTQDDLCRLRSIHVGFVSPSQLKRAKAEGKLDHLLAQRDEIEVPLDTGGTVTVVCCYVSPTSARFVFKDCWDEGVMNDEATNKTGYFKSKGRKHVLEDIYPHIAAEWREIIVPRTFVETIEGERVEYSDPLWLPSATDVFGTPDGAWWNDGDDDFQLPAFTLKPFYCIPDLVHFPGRTKIISADIIQCIFIVFSMPECGHCYFHQIFIRRRSRLYDFIRTAEQ